MNRSFPTLSRLWLLLLFMALQAFSMSAQYRYEQFTNLRYDDDEGTNFIIKSITDDMAAREAPVKVLSTAKYLLDVERLQYWTNGVYLFYSEYVPEENKVYFSYSPTTKGEPQEQLFIKPLNVNRKNRTVYLSGRRDLKFTVEQVGGRIVLVGRDTQGVPVFSLLNVSEQLIGDNGWILPVLYLFMGSHSVPGESGSHAVFGPKMDFYTGDKYDTDPGYINGIMFDWQEQCINILYGDGRVSRGNPSSPNWGKMPGGGGAGAIMGPMEWSIKPTVEGLRTVIVRDEKFVMHSPSIGQEGDTVMLTKVETPFEGLPGKWAFASVIPLTPELLRLFPRQVLTLMRGEIYARHGDTFRNPDTQRYFDAQPWYRRSTGGSPVTLTGLERFNYLLIQHVESSMH